MSVFFQGNAASNAFLRRSDNRHFPVSYDRFANTDRPFEPGRLWSRPRGIGDQFLDVLGMDASSGGEYESPPPTFGSQSMLKIEGVTKNSSGTPIGGVTLSLFLSTGKIWLRDCLSAADGSFIAYSQYSGQNHFIVAYLAGSPNTGGTTTYALVPS